MMDFLTALLTEYPLWLMFFSAFLSATLLPGNSEIVFVGLFLAEKELLFFNPYILLIVAVCGNSLGSFTTYAMARWLPKTDFSASQNAKVRWVFHQFQRYGEIALLLSWFPVVGDIFCAIAGWLRLNWWRSLLWISLGKALRYIALYFLIA